MRREYLPRHDGKKRCKLERECLRSEIAGIEGDRSAIREYAGNNSEVRFERHRITNRVRSRDRLPADSEIISNDREMAAKCGSEVVANRSTANGGRRSGW